MNALWYITGFIAFCLACFATAKGLLPGKQDWLVSPGIVLTTAALLAFLLVSVAVEVSIFVFGELAKIGV